MSNESNEFKEQQRNRGRTRLNLTETAKISKPVSNPEANNNPPGAAEILTNAVNNTVQEAESPLTVKVNTNSAPGPTPGIYPASGGNKSLYEPAKEWYAEASKAADNKYEYAEEERKVYYIDNAAENQKTPLFSLTEKAIQFEQNLAHLDKAIEASLGILAKAKVVNFTIKGGDKKQREALMKQIYNSAEYKDNLFRITVIGDDNKPAFYATKDEIAAAFDVTNENQKNQENQSKPRPN